MTQELANATAALSHADTTLAVRKAKIARAESLFLDAWGESALLNGPEYGPLLALRASIEDFPRCRKHLAAKVEAAKKALREFEKKNT